MEMTTEQAEILARLRDYLMKNPTIRFGQALVNLNIVQVTAPEDPLNTTDYIPRVADPYYDTDFAILKRMT